MSCLAIWNGSGNVYQCIYDNSKFYKKGDIIIVRYSDSGPWIGSGTGCNNNNYVYFRCIKNLFLSSNHTTCIRADLGTAAGDCLPPVANCNSPNLAKNAFWQQLSNDEIKYLFHPNDSNVMTILLLSLLLFFAVLFRIR